MGEEEGSTGTQAGAPYVLAAHLLETSCHAGLGAGLLRATLSKSSLGVST